MPIWLRKFTYHQIADFKKKEQEAYDKAMSKSSGNTSIDISKLCIAIIVVKKDIIVDNAINQ